ncbi:hypothetical protein MMC14_005937 [Varicellaria rhodocarpa]|nr:hypothetical protein [Varicellaria rhodocarpa]
MLYVSDNFVWLLLVFLTWPSSPASCKSLVNGRLDSGSSKSLLGPLHARALPNTRLCDAFGIDNAFTTTYVIRYKAFLKEARNLVQTDRWDEIRDFTIEVIKSSQTAHEANLEGILLVPFVGTIVLTVILYFFFNASIEDLNKSTVQMVAEKINDLWENPLDIILPTYETLWQVVLRCFMELRFRDVKIRPRAKTVFNKFLATLTPAQLDAGIEDIASDATSVR